MVRASTSPRTASPRRSIFPRATKRFPSGGIQPRTRRNAPFVTTSSAAPGGQFAVGIAYGCCTTGQLTWAVGCCGSITGTSYGNCPTTLTLNKWYQIILYSVSGSTTGLIVNGGSFCNSSTPWDSANISAGGANFTIGAQSGGLYPASGVIAEVAVWPSNLSAGFKQALATVCPIGGSARRMGLPKPAGYFPLWGASGSSVEPDLSGNLLNGALTGPPTPANHAPCTR